jgi:hypothetical protein
VCKTYKSAKKAPNVLKNQITIAKHTHPMGSLPGADTVSVCGVCEVRGKKKVTDTPAGPLLTLNGKAALADSRAFLGAANKKAGLRRPCP